MEAKTYESEQLKWYTIIHMAFVVSALLLPVLDKIAFQKH